MKRFIQGLKTTTFQLWFILFVFLCLGIAACLILKNDPSQLGISPGSVWQERLFFVAMMLTGGLLLFIIVFFISTYIFGRSAYRKAKARTGGESSASSKDKNTNDSPIISSLRELKSHMRRRYNLFWRYKVRLLLVTGNEEAIEQLVPGLQKNQWLEGNRTVLIYGGSLTAEHNKEKYTALRKLRRGRPLDGIVRVLPQKQNLTPQISDNDLRGLEKISELLRYSAPVWIWKLCDSDWSQTNRTEQAVGASFPLRARADDVPAS